MQVGLQSTAWFQVSAASRIRALPSNRRPAGTCRIPTEVAASNRTCRHPRGACL